MDDDPGQRRGIDRERGLGRRDGDQAGAEPGGGARREARRAGHHRAAGHQRVSAGVFVAVEAGPRQAGEPPAGVVRGGVGATRSSTASGMPICASTVSPQWIRPGSSRCPGFWRKKVTVSAAIGAAPRISPLAPSTPLGTSTATTGSPPPAERLDDRERRTLDRPRQPGAEHRVDDQPGAVERRGRQRLDRPRPARRPRPRRRRAAPRGRRAAPAAPSSRARPGCAPRQTRRRHCCRVRTAQRPAAAASAARRRRRPRAPHSPSARCRRCRRRSPAGPPRPSAAASAARGGASPRGNRHRRDVGMAGERAGKPGA